MARVLISKNYPFAKWDPVRKYGTHAEDTFITIEMETAKSKARAWPFIVTSTWGTHDTFTCIDDAVAFRVKETQAMSRLAGWTPEQEG